MYKRQVLRRRVECLRDYVVVDVAKCVAHAKQELQLVQLGDSATPQKREFVTCATQLLEDVVALISLDGPEFVARVTDVMSRVQAMRKDHIGDRRYFDSLASQLSRFRALSIIGESRAQEALEGILSLSKQQIRQRLESIPLSLRTLLGLHKLPDSCRASEWVPVLWRAWLRMEGARQMDAEDTWRNLMGNTSLGVLDAPLAFSLDGAAFELGVSLARVSASHVRAGREPLSGMWWRLTWIVVCTEVRTRYERLRVMLTTVRDDCQVVVDWSLEDLYRNLQQIRSNFDEEVEKKLLLVWQSVRDVEERAGRQIQHHELGRFNKNNKPTGSVFDAQSIVYMWSLVESAVARQDWEAIQGEDVAVVSHTAVESASVAKELSSFPRGEMECHADYWYSWRRFWVEAWSDDQAYEMLNRKWQEQQDKQRVAKSMLAQHRTMQLKRLKSETARGARGKPLILKSSSYTKQFQGRLTEEGTKLCFVEDTTWFRASVTVPTNMQSGGRQYLSWRDEQLYKAMRAEHAKASRARTRAAREEHVEAQLPKTTGDLCVKGTDDNERLIYAWGSAEVHITPSKSRPVPSEGASKWQQANFVEATPDRALRKMKRKVKQRLRKAAAGECERIVARDSSVLEETKQGALTALCPAMNQLDDPTVLQYLGDAYHYLNSAKLQYCPNCDEEWVYFTSVWPQNGVACAGPKAGKCETSARCGYVTSSREDMCHRCASSASYREMFSQENQQHLGPRHEALSRLTWYESLLIARVHPVISVVTLTATGLLCYAGHVTNYYMKTLEWFTELPQILRDKQWFLIKRRRSVHASEGEARQKKPTTANRNRLYAAIEQVLKCMPNVYKDSTISQEALSKFPVLGEQEMLEQESVVDLSGEVSLEREMFCAWFDLGKHEHERLRCSVAVRRYAFDHLGPDLRGDVNGDTAWELCCRLLHLSETVSTLGSGDVAQLIVYWLATGQLPAEMNSSCYEGCVDDLNERGKSVATEDDEQEMKCRWMKQRMHSELDMTRDVWLSRQEEAPVHLEVEFEMHETEQQSVIVQSEKAASRLLVQLGGDTVASAAKSPPPALPSEGRAYWAADEHPDPDHDDPAEDFLVRQDDQIAEVDAVVVSNTTAEATDGFLARGKDGAAPGDDDAQVPRGDANLLSGQAEVTVEQHFDAKKKRLVEAKDVMAVSLLQDQMHNYEASIRVLLLQKDFAGAGALQQQMLDSLRVEAMSNSVTSNIEEHAAAETSVDKPLVDGPEHGERIKDTEPVPFWIPAAFPQIFQNETGDPHNYKTKYVDLIQWGPHILRSRGWHAQAHMTFMYWWLNMIQRFQVLSAKKWYVRDNPEAQGYTVGDLSNMSVRNLAKQMVGYTANIPGTRASKNRLRRLLIAMVTQIEIETRFEDSVSTTCGDIPCLFGTLTSQRYHWDDIIRFIVEVIGKDAGIDDYKNLSKSKRRELVNKYPLWVAYYCAVRLELALKAVVVPLFGASAYIGVFEWSPTGAMVHLHYVLWKKGAPRFDLQAAQLKRNQEELRKSVILPSGRVECSMKYVVDFFAKYVSEWNPNKDHEGKEEACHVAETVNQTHPHVASLNNDEMIQLLQDDRGAQRLDCLLYTSPSPRD